MFRLMQYDCQPATVLIFAAGAIVSSRPAALGRVVIELARTRIVLTKTRARYPNDADEQRMLLSQRRLAPLAKRKLGGNTPGWTVEIPRPAKHTPTPFPTAQRRQNIAAIAGQLTSTVQITRHERLVGRNIRVIPGPPAQHQLVAIIHSASAAPDSISGRRTHASGAEEGRQSEADAVTPKPVGRIATNSLHSGIDADIIRPKRHIGTNDFGIKGRNGINVGCYRGTTDGVSQEGPDWKRTLPRARHFFEIKRRCARA
eukprot:IDg22541t1